MPVFFARVIGPKGYRELKAVISTGCKYCMAGYKDIREIGYDNVPYPGVFVEHAGLVPNGVWIVTTGSINQCSLTELDEISIGDVSAKKVATLIYNPPQESGVDLILGESFLKNFSVHFDYGNRTLKIEPIGAVRAQDGKQQAVTANSVKAMKTGPEQ